MLSTPPISVSVPALRGSSSTVSSQPSASHSLLAPTDSTERASSSQSSSQDGAPLSTSTAVVAPEAVVAPQRKRPELNAQTNLCNHLAREYGTGLADAVVDAVNRKGEVSGLDHPTQARLELHPAVNSRMASLLAQPNSPVALGEDGLPRLVDRARSAEVLVELASALPKDPSGVNCALLIDGANDDRLSFGVKQGNYIDAISSAVMFAGSARQVSHGDRDTLDFLQSKSIVWTLQTSPLGLAGAQWADVREVHSLVEPALEAPLSASFASRNYELFAPGDASNQGIAGFSELQKRAYLITRGEFSPTCQAEETFSLPEGFNWPAQASLKIDEAVLRVAEAFVSSLGDSARVEMGKMYIGGEKTGLTREDALKICADLSLVLSAVAKTDNGLDAGGPFGTVVWNPENGGVTVGKNQVVPSKAPCNHGERTGLFLHPEDHAAREVVITSAEPCSMCYLACDERDMDVAFVVTSEGVENNTPFKEGKKNWAEFSGEAMGPKACLDEAGTSVINGKSWLASRAELGAQILNAWTHNGEDYSV